LISYRRRLPHLYYENSPVFVTWRMHFSLPQPFVIQMKTQKDQFEAQIQQLSDDYQNLQRYQFAKKQFDQLDDLYATNPNFPQLLNSPEIQKIVADSLAYKDGLKYSLHAYCIMPNHVHMLITPFCEASSISSALGKITQSIKGFTAHEINRLLKREGQFWNKESYDHYVRNDDEYLRIVKYICFNPVKAGMTKEWRDWHGTWVESGLEEDVY